MQERLAQKGLALQKPAGVSDDEWKKQTAATYPIFHSAMALDDDVSARKTSRPESRSTRTELMLYPPRTTKSGPGLVDTLQLAEAYTKPDGEGSYPGGLVLCACWNFAPPAYKAQIEPKLEYYYKKYPWRSGPVLTRSRPRPSHRLSSGNLHDHSCEQPAEQIHDLLRRDSGPDDAGTCR